MPSFARFRELNGRPKSLLVYLSGLRVRFHIQRLRAPIMIKPRKLGHRGIGEPATITSGRVTSRINCAMAIRPNTTLATRKPVICDLIVFSLDMGPMGLMCLTSSTGRISIKGKCHSSDFCEKYLIAIGESGCCRPPIAPMSRRMRRAGSEDRKAIASLRPRRGSDGTSGLAWGPVAL